MEMLNFLKTMDENANNKVVSTSVLERHTNKTFLVGKFKALYATVDYNVHAVKHSSSGLNLQQQTVTPNIQPSNIVPLNVQNCVRIKHLQESVNEPMFGKFLLCRTISPPCKVTALISVIDDPDGQLAANLILYNFVPTVTTLSSTDAYHYLPVGTVLAIMNPWLKSSADGGLAVRCDNPSHVVMLDASQHYDILCGLTWQGEIPSDYQHYFEFQGGDETSALHWKKVGNNHFSAKRFKESIAAYTNGIASENIEFKLRFDLLSNRSAAYLKLGRYDLALSDAQTVLNVDEAHIKCIYRKANALIGMARYADAVSFIRNVTPDVSSSADRKTIASLISKCEKFIAQSVACCYPWKEIFGNKLDDHRHDIAEYLGTVVVKDSPEKGRGLFATETIAAGQLLLASRAFAIAISNKRDGLYLNYRSTKWLVTRSQTELVTTIAQILTNCPDKCAEFHSLYGGVEYRNETSSRDDQVDVKRIEEICRYNAFGHGGLTTTNTDNDVSGIWIQPSFINHSCVDANSMWQRNGDFLFVRAFQDIRKGEEILISYFEPLRDVAENRSENYGFTCDCRLCKRDQLDSSQMLAYRSNLKAKLETLFKENRNDLRFDEALTVIKLLNKSREDAPDLNLFFLLHVTKLATLYFEKGFYSECASTSENVYRTIEGVASLFEYTLATVVNIISSYGMTGDKHNLKRWHKVLKQKTLLYYGSLDVVDVLVPEKIVSMLKNFGFR